MSILTEPISIPRLAIPRARPRTRRAPSVTGLEIEATQTIAAQAGLEDGEIALERAAARPLPAGLLRDGVVLDPEGLAQELRDFFAEHRLAKRVRVGLATPRTVVRVIDLPPLDEKDVKVALRMQAQARIPMPLDRAVMDYQTVGLIDTSEGRRLRVVAVVTERDVISQLTSALQRAGLKAVGVDLSIFAVIRALRGHHGGDDPVLFAQVGDLANIAIAEAGVCRFTRMAPLGLGALLERFGESRDESPDDAMALIRAIRAGDEQESADDGDSEIHQLIARHAADLGSELRKAAEFYSSQFGTVPVAEGLVTGPLALIPGFVDAAAAASGLALTCGEVRVAPKGSLGDVDARLAALAGGLAVGALG